ncbi:MULTISPECIES: hypothetical protein [Haloferacaceae]|uniref:Uncharacterized protein n=2 Tax=Haloferacaceae TaxID=1644056 RepID=A0ABD6DB37_9EURY|nr:MULTISPECIES: hypothetical protein [Halorubraceae]
MEKVKSPEEGFTHWYDEDIHSAINPINYTQALIDEMGLKSGDVYLANGKAHQIESIDIAVDRLVLADPTVNHPQDARSGQWSVPITGLYQDWRQGKIDPATMDAVA